MYKGLKWQYVLTFMMELIKIYQLDNFNLRIAIRTKKLLYGGQLFTCTTFAIEIIIKIAVGKFRVIIY